jgi:hypothetical protein
MSSWSRVWEDCIEKVPFWSGDTAAVAGAILPGQRAFLIIGPTPFPLLERCTQAKSSLFIATAVALWIAAGAGLKEVATRAGHTSVSFALDRYGHLHPEADTALRDRLDALYLAGPRPSPVW